MAAFSSIAIRSVLTQNQLKMTARRGVMDLGSDARSALVRVPAIALLSVVPLRIRRRR